jgi:hypothetical protein
MTLLPRPEAKTRRHLRLGKRAHEQDPLMFLLTWHGTFVSQPDQAGVLRHEALAGNGALSRALFLDIPDSAEHAGLRHPELGMLRIEAAPLPGAICLLREGFYLCADANNGLAVFDRPQPAAWESFLLLSEQDAAGLDFILRHRWIVRETRQVIRRGDIALHEDFRLRLGAYEANLATSLRTLATRRREGLPIAITLTHGGSDIDLVVAEPRNSALVHTELWPPRARRTSELLTFAVHRIVVGREPTQEDFERDVTFLRERQGAPGLEDLLEEVIEAPAAKAASPRPHASQPENTHAQAIMMGWAMREVAHWLFHPLRHVDARSAFDHLNETLSWISIFRIAAGEVTVKPKPAHVQPRDILPERTERYRQFLQTVVPLLPPGFSTTLCMAMGDAVPAAFDVPVFAFQKKAGWNVVLLPDVDFLNNDFYDRLSQQDRLTYREKQQIAVFAGSTTGGLITPKIARDLSIPRLRAARYFDGSAKVDFRLPVIIQCSSPEAEAILRAQAFCQKPGLSWDEQFSSRMIISMDGNGATCSRVAVALHSNSVLLKYHSDEVLYYFGGLQPWVHYVPVVNDSDIDQIVEMETRDADMFARIAENGRSFAQSFLTANALRSYTAMLLLRYEACFSDAAPPLPALRRSPEPPPLPAGETSVMMAHVQSRGDRSGAVGSWLGERGSTLAIEGFAISLAADFPGGFTYRAMMANGALSDIARNGEYRGTRGENLPTYGFLIALDGDFAEEYEVEYEATFIDGSAFGPVSAGTLCVSPSFAKMEAMRVSVYPKT